ncbi:MAG: diguanylate cyclase [Rhodospirillaceae bacterium]|nr:MAG: diguanylate cyclase [Rhodospirillaceae bacterium]
MNNLERIAHGNKFQHHDLSDSALDEMLRTLLQGLQRISDSCLVTYNQWLHIVAFTIGMAIEAQQRLTASHERIAHLERLSITDELTGLLNRRGIEHRLRDELAAPSAMARGGVLIFIDLDGLKPVNDTFGPAAGDKVLRQVAGLLRANVRESDSLGRIGGDEFVVLMPRSPRHIGLLRTQTIEKLMNDSYAS